MEKISNDEKVNSQIDSHIKSIIYCLLNGENSKNMKKKNNKNKNKEKKIDNSKDGFNGKLLDNNFDNEIISKYLLNEKTDIQIRIEKSYIIIDNILKNQCLIKKDIDYDLKCIKNELLSVFYTYYKNFKENLFYKSKVFDDNYVNKRIYFMRHAIASHNFFSLNRNKTISDPELTKEGKEQCEIYSRVLKELKIEIFVSSPLFRALQTSYIVSRKCDNKKILCLPTFRETFKKISDVGTVSSKLKFSLKNYLSYYDKDETNDVIINEDINDKNSELNYFDFSYINKEHWWSHLTDNVESLLEAPIEIEKIEEVRCRTIIGFIWLFLRKEKSICLISHSKIFKIYPSNKDIKNCQIKLLSNLTLIELFINYLQEI